VFYKHRFNPLVASSNEFRLKNRLGGFFVFKRTYLPNILMDQIINYILPGYYGFDFLDDKKCTEYSIFGNL
jgi:hypothetical protein